MARLTIRTPQVEAVILEAVERGVSNRNAAAIAGISHETLYRWMREDEGFRSRVLQSRGIGVDAAARTVRQLMDSQDDAVRLRAATAFLKAHDESWADKSEVKHSGSLTIAGLLAEVERPTTEGSGDDLDPDSP